MQVSKNYNKGKAITDINDLLKLARTKKAVYNVNLKKIQPAAVTINMSVAHVDKMIRLNKLFRIVKKR